MIEQFLSLDWERLGRFVVSAGFGAAVALGIVWRRLSLVEHLQDTLHDLHDVGCQIQVVELDKHQRPSSLGWITIEGQTKDFLAFNQRLAAAKELLDAIETRTRR